MEWQANFFAASPCLFLEATIHDEVVRVQGSMGIRTNLGRVILEAKRYSCKDFNDLLENLCLTYDVSKTVMQNRLSTLGILIDLRDKNVKHVTEAPPRGE